MRELSYRAAIREAMQEAMHADENVFVLGEDVEYGGVYGITKDFLKEFGPNRIVDTPIAETAIIGAATGAALLGMRPIAEIQFADFITPAMDELVNMTAKYHYRNRIPVPMVVRAPSGAIVTDHGSTGPFHSQNLESWFAHSPGLKVITPATPYDAKGMLYSAIADPNPVLFLEQKSLYTQKGHVPKGHYTVPIGQADLARPGDDLALITYGAMRPACLQAAQQAESFGLSVAVLDLRSLVPLDEAALFDIVRQTSKIIIVHEATRTAGFGAELSARIAEEAFEDLDGPVLRVTAPDTPTPASPVLIDAFLPNTDKILAAIQKLAAY